MKQRPLFNFTFNITLSIFQPVKKKKKTHLFITVFVKDSLNNNIMEFGTYGHFVTILQNEMYTLPSYKMIILA